MAKLIYIANCSLDGYTEDESGSFDWTEPSAEVHHYITDLIRPVGTHLYGRRMYETMAVWETMESSDLASIEGDFAAVWRDADKIVYSRTLESATTSRTELRREFDPDEVSELKATAAADLTIGGPELAAEAFAAGLIDDVHLFVSPVSIGGGKPALPRHQRIDFDLVEERRFANGVVHLRVQPSMERTDSSGSVLD